MKPQKFIQSFKCECFQPYNYCTCSQKSIASKALIENVTDIAESLIEVMTLCGIHLTRAKLSFDVILYYFLHFEEVRHRIDSVPRKRLNKEDLLHDLARKCGMNRINAQIAYSIIKRAFKAFYFGTDIGGVPNHFLSAQLTHTSKCLWAHAAQRTAQVYAAYEGIFYACQKDLECRIKLIYKQLYDRICERTQTDDDQECMCMQCMKRIAKESLKIVKVTTGIHKLSNPYEAIYRKERMAFMMQQKIQDEHEEDEAKKGQYSDSTVGRKNEGSSCRSLSLTEVDYAYRDNAESAYTGSSQGPFVCCWFPISKEEYEADEADVKIELPEEITCPPCSIDAECESICECTCDDCTCTTDVYCGGQSEQGDNEDQTVTNEKADDELEDVESEVEFKCRSDNQNNSD